jgi:predicted nuclease with TOPRIM domain
MSEQEIKLIDLAEGLKATVENSAERLRNLRKHLTNIEIQLDSASDTITKALKPPEEVEVPLEESTPETSATITEPEKKIDPGTAFSEDDAKQYWDSVVEEWKTKSTSKGSDVPE